MGWNVSKALFFSAKNGAEPFSWPMGENKHVVGHSCGGGAKDEKQRGRQMISDRWTALDFFFFFFFFCNLILSFSFCFLMPVMSSPVQPGFFALS